MRLDKLIETEGLRRVAGLTAGGWEWGAVEVYYKPAAGRFYWNTESGCSCNGYGEGDTYELGNFSDGDRDAAIAALKGFSHYDGAPAQDAVDREVAKVRDFRPEVAA